jgi:phosphocarrier protein
MTVKNKMGIHARPAAMIVRLANRYSDTELFVQKEEEEVNGKSIMGLMVLAAGYGSRLNFRAVGPQSRDVLQAVEDLFERKFDEA